MLLLLGCVISETIGVTFSMYCDTLPANSAENSLYGGFYFVIRFSMASSICGGEGQIVN
jgi:hypothetical protein